MFTTLRLAPPRGVIGSTVELLPFLDYNAEWDLGDAQVIQRAFTENPLIPGGVLTSETAGVRRMTLPLVLASTASYGLSQLEHVIRQRTRPGAWMEFRGAGASTLMRIDILGGDLVYQRFNPRIAQVGRRPARLVLDVQPFAYPASGMILLASSASVGLPGKVSLVPNSMPGDAPGYMRVIISPTTGAAGQLVAAGTWLMDSLAWAIDRRSTNYFGGDQVLPIGSWFGGTPVVATRIANDRFVPLDPGGASQSVRLFPAAGQGWTPAVYFQSLLDITDPLQTDGQLQGRYRAFAYARVGPSMALPFLLSIDSDVPRNGAGGAAYGALASAAMVATVAPGVATGTPGIWGAQTATAYQLVDLGELTFPAIPSGFYIDGSSNSALISRARLWVGPATTGTYGVATPVVDIAGVFLQPLDWSAGVLPRGLAHPTHSLAGAPNGGIESHRLYLDSRPQRRHVLLTREQSTGSTLANNWPFADLTQHYRGDFPLLPYTEDVQGAYLHIIGGARSIASGATGPVAYSHQMSAAVSVEYSPQFVFLPFPEVI